MSIMLTNDITKGSKHEIYSFSPIKVQLILHDKDLPIGYTTKKLG